MMALFGLLIISERGTLLQPWYITWRLSTRTLKMNVHNIHFCKVLSGLFLTHFCTRIFVPLVVYVVLYSIRFDKNIRFCPQGKYQKAYAFFQ